MDYEAVLADLYRLERFGIKLGLGNIRKLLSLLGDPQRGLRAIHITGTNGKGSVSACTASALLAAGYRVGLYTSPHLVRFNERIRVDGAPISDGDVLRLWNGMGPAVRAMAGRHNVNHPTFFEVTTAMAFQYFRERGVEVAVVEVGMGGRNDATNVIDGLVAVVTRIGLEHTEHLGKTVSRIAREKSGIIKPGARVVTVNQEALPVIEARCQEVGASLTVVGRDVRATRVSQDLHGQRINVSTPKANLVVETPLLGAFQIENIAIAVAALHALQAKGFDVPDAAVIKGFRTTEWPGRLQVIRDRPLLLVDGAHNGPAAYALASSLSELVPGKSVGLVIGILNDKDLHAFADALGPMARRVFASRPKTPRAYDAEEVAAAFRAYADVAVIPEVTAAIDAALAEAGPEDVVLVTGSIYTAGEALAHLGTTT